MTRRFDVNDGSRPDLLELGRRATGEVEGEVPEAFTTELEDAKSKLPAFDYEILRARSHRVDASSAPDWEPRPDKAPPARKRSWWWGLVPVMVATVALALIIPWKGYVGVKGHGGVRLDHFVLLDGEVHAGDPDQVLAEGDRVQFTYMAAGLDTLVLLSVDGDGTLTVFWPEEGDEPVPVQERGTHLLDGSVELDDAPGPEVFVGLFGFDRVTDARMVAEDAWLEGGVDALLDLADDSPDIDVIIIDKER